MRLKANTALGMMPDSVIFILRSVLSTVTRKKKNIHGPDSKRLLVFSIKNKSARKKKLEPRRQLKRLKCMVCMWEDRIDPSTILSPGHDQEQSQTTEVGKALSTTKYGLKQNKRKQKSKT